jgi:formate hydrogenlyase subunit 6/NADH:ubiquinone oxidoreductase subunit I
MAYFEMTKLALKWAMTKPATSQYPFVPRQAVTGSRGRLVFTKDNCIYCNVCAKKCPTDALVVNRKEKKWILDQLRCITCGYCVEVCPKKSLSMGTGHDRVAVTRDHEIH